LRTITGQVVQDVGFVKTLDAIDTIYRERRAKPRAGAGPRKVGLGVASLGYGIGYSGVRNPSIARMTVDVDGEVSGYCGTPDIGTGSDTALAQILADAAGIALARIRVVSGDSTATDDSGPTSASRTTYFSGNAAHLCGQDFRRKFERAVASRLGVDPGRTRLANDAVVADGRHLKFEEACRLLADEIAAVAGYGKFDPDSALDIKTFMGDPYPTYTYATHLAEVEVDEETGRVELKAYWAAHDAGKLVNRRGAEGQVEGGVIMGLGMALWEKIVREDGHVLNPNYMNYLLPGARDIPDELRTIFVDNHDHTGPYGAKGLAEASIIPVPAAIAAAIHDAVGVRPDHLPMGAEEIIALLRQRSGGASTTGP
jgi:CO/xanthine dehydrogenase Mo-binding subunit